MSVATIDDDRLDVMYAALADRTRRRILSHLTDGDATVNELAAPFDITVQAVSQHIRVLEHAGLITRSRHRQTRPCRLDPAALEQAIAWIDDQHAAWEGRLERLDSHLATIRRRRTP